VNNHQIVFDYQEMAIIKKFNKALDNLGDKSHAVSLAKASKKSASVKSQPSLSM